MPKQAWYSDNEHRDYPFITRTEPLDYVAEPLSDPDEEESSSSAGSDASLPQELIVDFGAIAEVDSAFYNSSGHYVYLHAIEREGDTLRLRLRITSGPARTEECIFTRELPAEEFQIEWVDATPIAGLESDSVGCPFEPKWRAFLVTGLFAEIADLLPADGELVFARGLWRAEPARIQSLADTYLRSLNLANLPRVKASPPVGCGEAADDDEPVVDAFCLSGDISFVEGFNVSIRQENQNNAIIIGAGAGAGAGQPCDELPLEPAEEPPPGSPYLSGGPGCHQILKSLNGVVGRNLTIIAGAGFVVRADDEVENTLVIDRDLHDFAVCPDPTEISSESLGE